MSYEEVDNFYSVDMVKEPVNHRPPIPAKVRQAVLERDNHACAICGGTEHLHIDHILPVARGGTNDPENLQVLCRECNWSKGGEDDVGKRWRRYVDGIDGIRQTIRQFKPQLLEYKKLSMAQVSRTTGMKYELVLAYQNTIRRELGIQ